MKKHKDLLQVLKANNMRITPARRFLLQFILDSKKHAGIKTGQITLKSITRFMEKILPGVNRSSIYRNIEAFKKLDIIQEISLPSGSFFQYVFDCKVHHFYICKSCGKASVGNEKLFNKIEAALKDIHGFAKANLSIVFYGYCSKCGH
ncbi:MAG: transcriptional repressor [Bdellovibrio sp.]|nr:transcriptional repressor [Bdellovibrio sp.]